MRPGYGFVEPHKQFCITLICKPFRGTHLSKRDRFTILLAEAPDNTKGKRPSRAWKDLALTIVRRHVLPVTYVPEKAQEPRQKDDKVMGQVRPEQAKQKKSGEEVKQKKSKEEVEQRKKEEKRRQEAEKEKKEAKKQDIERQKTHDSDSEDSEDYSSDEDYDSDED